MNMKNQHRGFTLIEAMIAVTILTLATAGPLITAKNVFVASLVARDQLTASYLAQEGIEYVLAMRDDEFLASYPSDEGWDNFIDGIETYCLDSFCTVDSYFSVPMGYGTGKALNACSGVCEPLYKTSDGFYTQKSGGNTQTIFTRTIQAVHISDNDEQIVSTVSWDHHGVLHSITIYDHLTPWK